MNRRLTKFGLFLVVAVAGCKDTLVVENPNSPDRDRALARPGDVENLAAGQFRVIFNALWTTGGMQPQLGVLGGESFSGNANFGMGVRVGIPRALIDNSRGNPADFYATWSILQQAARAEALTLSRFNAADFTFFPTSAAQLARIRAFAFFNKGLAQGYTALTFDSGPVIRATDDLGQPNLMVGYDTLMKYALLDLDSAIAAASLTATGGNPFPLPATWIQGPGSWTGGVTGTFVRLIRSYKARFRANVARTPAERALVNWPLVIADAQNGVTSDFLITLTNVGGGWFYNPMQMSTFASWHSMWQAMLGMADTSGALDTWLNTSRQNKVPFVVQTADRRFPSGGTVGMATATARPLQNASSGCSTGTTCAPPGTAGRNANQFFRNRIPGQDVQVDGLFFSFYDFDRFQAYYDANSNGTLPFLTVAELNMLQAEGYIRAGNFAAASALITTSRTARGLPALPTITALTDLITGPACTPRVPVGPTNQANMTATATACGNIMEAMKWEKRLETAFTHFGAWYFDGRGWGDLPFGTPVQFPVPYTELDARGQLIYSVPTTVGGSVTYTAAERLSNSASGYGLGSP